MGFFEQRQRTKKLQQLLTQQDAILSGEPVAELTSAQSAVEIALKADVDKIRAMPSHADRNVYKRDHFLPKWLPYVDDYIAKGENYANLTLAYCLVYSFDIGAFEKAFELTEIAIKQGQVLPENFKSSAAAFASSFVLEWAENCAAQGQPFEPYVSQTLRKVIGEWNLHEVIKAKWLKFTAQSLITDTDGKVVPANIFEPKRLTLAKTLLEYAFTLNPRAGVTTLLDRIQMRLKALASQGAHSFDMDAENLAMDAPNGGQLKAKEIVNAIDDIAALLISPPLSKGEYLKQRNENNV